MLYLRDKTLSFLLMLLVPLLGWQTAAAQEDHHPPVDSEFVDLGTIEVPRWTPQRNTT